MSAARNSDSDSDSDSNNNRQSLNNISDQDDIISNGGGIDDSGNDGGADEELDLEWEEWDPSSLSFTDHMLAGSFAGLAEHVSIFPMDTLKTNMQCSRCDQNQGRPFQTLRCAQRIVKQSGALRLWRGVSAMFAGCIPAHAAYFSLFESMKVALGADQQGHYPLRAAVCGASATLVHDLMMTPFDVVKQRMQLGYHHSVLDCARTILRTEGPRAFYLSFPTTVAMNVPYGCVMVAVNESSRKVILDHMRPPSSSSSSRHHRPKHSHWQCLSASLLSGGVAGAVAALLTTPLDVVKTRLQTQSLVSQSLTGSSSSSSLLGVASVPPLAPPLPLACPAFSTSASGSTTQATRHLASASSPAATAAATTLCPKGVKAAGCVGNSSSSSGSGIGSGSRMAGGAGDPSVVEVARRYRSMGQTFRSVVREEGYMALLTGAVPRILVHAPSVAVSWTAYELAKTLLAGAKQ